LYSSIYFFSFANKDFCEGTCVDERQKTINLLKKWATLKRLHLRSWLLKHQVFGSIDT